jgi:hypothetical protein
MSEQHQEQTTMEVCFKQIMLFYKTHLILFTGNWRETNRCQGLCSREIGLTRTIEYGGLFKCKLITLNKSCL